MKHSKHLWIQIKDMPKENVHAHHYPIEKAMKDLRKMYDEFENDKNKKRQ